MTTAQVTRHKSLQVYLDGDMHSVGMTTFEFVAYVWWVRARAAAGQRGGVA